MNFQKFCRRTNLLRHSLSSFASQSLGAKWIKAFVFLLFLLGVGIIFCCTSYWYAASRWNAHQTALLDITQKRLLQASLQYEQFLHLLESRIVNAVLKGQSEKIPSILSFKGELLSDGPFPEITSASFSLHTQPSILYTRIGITQQKTQITLPSQSQTIFSLGDKKFKTIKRLHTAGHKPLGILQVSFSLAHLLKNSAFLKEIHFISSNATLPSQVLHFEISHFPGIFTIAVQRLTLWSYLWDHLFQIMLCIGLGSAAFFCGMLENALRKRKQWNTLRSDYNYLSQKMECLKANHTKQEEEVIKLSSILQARSQHEKSKEKIFSQIQRRYRHVSAQALSLNLLISKLFSEEWAESKAGKEIQRILDESNVFLRRLVKGQLLPDNDRTVDILQSIQSIRELFEAEIHEKEIQFEVTEGIKESIYFDKVLFDVLLHNLFRCVIKRLMKGGKIRIELSDSLPLQIIFYDNGYDIEAAERAVAGTEADSLFSLSQQEMRGWAVNLGGQLEFQVTEGEFHHKTILSLPQQLSEMPSNVVNLFAFA